MRASLDYAIIRNNTPEKISGAFTDNQGIKHSANVLRLWSDIELKSIDVYPVTEVQIPDGSVSTGSELYFDGHTITRIHTLVAASSAYQSAYQARAAMVEWIDDLTHGITSRYPKAVQARWEIEESAARAVKAGTETPDQHDLISNEGAAKDRTPEQHADAIIANADRFHAIAGQINQLFLATDKALADATEPAQYEAILDAAKLQAAALAATYGLSTETQGALHRHDDQR